VHSTCVSAGGPPRAHPCVPPVDDGLWALLRAACGREQRGDGREGSQPCAARRAVSCADAVCLCMPVVAQAKLMRLMGAGKKKNKGLFGGLAASKKPEAAAPKSQSTGLLNNLETHFEESRMYSFGGGYGRQRVRVCACGHSCRRRRGPAR